MGLGMMKIRKLLLSFFLMLFLVGCANSFHPLGGLGFNFHGPAFQKAYDDAVVFFERKAEAGEISWVEAAQKIRQADWNLAEAKRTEGFDTTWKFDLNDEEYHAYCIALAERVDKGLVSPYEYRAARIAKFNEISVRQQMIGVRQQQIDIQRQNQRILQQQQNTPSKEVTCSKIGSVVTCR